ncbi:hypothetical protein NBRC116493_33220 [Aurantivibrio infirmus]
MKLRYLILPLAIASASSSWAATDGTLGATSAGTTVVSVDVPDTVQVSVEQNVNMTYNQGVDSTGSTGICIYHRAVATAALTLSSSNQNSVGGTNPTLFNMLFGGNLLPYTVALSGASVVGSVTSGAKMSSIAADSAQVTCNGAFPISIDVNVSTGDLESTPAGTYTDTVTVLVEPT